MPKGKEQLIDIAAAFDDSVESVMQKKTAEFIGDGVSTLEEYCKFSSGKNDLQQWVERNRIIYGKSFSYTSVVNMVLGKRDKQLIKAPRPYLTQYINDQCQDKTIIKCRQSELTENEFNENTWLAATLPYTNIRHIFPTSGMALQIAKEKFDPGILHSPSIKRLIEKPYTLTSKKFINGSFYTIDGSWSDHGGRGPSSDKITFDEYESQNPHIEEIYSESTSHSNLARRTRISTPLLPNSGIDEKYNAGCRYNWTIVCPKCKRKQVMIFPDNLINFFEADSDDIEKESYMKRIDNVYIGCKHCGAYINKVSPHYLKTSKWIAERRHLEGIKASYRITYMMLPWKTGKEVLMKYHSFKFIHQFWNEVMGYAFVDPTAQLTRAIFEQCIDSNYKNIYRTLGQVRNVAVGVDWGLESWVVVKGNNFEPNKKLSKTIYVEKINSTTLREHGYEGLQTDHVKRVAEIFIFFKGKVLVNDANGIGVDRNEWLIKKFPTKAWGCFYDTAENQKQKKRVALLKPQFNKERRTVTVSRLIEFKSMIRMYEEIKSTIPQLSPEVETFIQHHTNIAVVKMVDEKTAQIFEIVGRTGPDHFAHADVYAKIGFDSLVNTERETTLGSVGDSNKNESKVDINAYVDPDSIY